MEEHLLIEGCKQGKSWAHKKLYELYAPVMMGVCMRYLNNKENAKDVLQEGFIKIFTKIDTYSGIGSFGGWIRRIFVTTALEYLRNRDALKLNFNLDDYEGSTESLAPSVLDKLSADDLLSCVARLPSGFRTVFNMYAIEGYTHAEIAKMLKIKESTSRSQFMRARKVLQESVQSFIICDNE